MTKPKKQHWVPRFYLKEFATPNTKGTKKPKVNIFSKREGDPKVVNIKDIAAKRYLYSPKDDDGNRSWSTEDRLADLESVVAKIWPTFANEFVDLDSESIRKCISLFVSTLILRHPSKLLEYEILQQQMIEGFDSWPKDDNGRPNVSHVETKEGVFELDTSDWEKYANPTDYDRKKFFIYQIKHGAIDIAEILMQKRWSIIFSEAPGFITSDQPVSIFNFQAERYGVATKGTFINMPISPTRVLMLDDRFEEPGSQYYRLSEHGPGPANSVTWANTHEFMITSRDIDEVCEEMLSIEVESV